MFFIEDNKFLTKKQKNKIEKMLGGEQLPFYIAPCSTTEDTNDVSFVHHVIHREYPDEDNSDLKDFFVELLDTFCKKHKITYTKIHRCAINTTFNTGVEKCGIHTDHDFPHNQLIIYLNEAENGDTVILDKEKKPFKVVKPERFKGICFQNTSHYHYFPTKGIRIVSVVTFS
tara:strand:+ start:44 stop:559 length:516 start_codon:yes stop_codon:yes gene_type:complete